MMKAGILPLLLLLPLCVQAAEFGHVHLAAPDSAEAAAWYQKHFGGRLSGFGGNIGPDTPVDRVDFGNVLLIFAQREPTGPSRDSVLRSIAFSVPDPAAKSVALGDYGAAVQSPDCQPSGHCMVVVEDPWGTRIVLLDDAESRGFHHVQLAVEDPGTALVWYQRMLGGELSRYGGERPALQFANGVRLVADESESPHASKGRSLDHLGWNVRELDEVVERLRSRGVPITMAPRQYRNIRIAFIEGPDGARIELVER